MNPTTPARDAAMTAPDGGTDAAVLIRDSAVVIPDSGGSSACTSSSECDPGFACVDARCVARPDSGVAPCGQLGEECCPGDACDSGFLCQSTDVPGWPSTACLPGDPVQVEVRITDAIGPGTPSTWSLLASAGGGPLGACPAALVGGCFVITCEDPPFGLSRDAGNAHFEVGGRRQTLSFDGSAYVLLPFDIDGSGAGRSWVLDFAGGLDFPALSVALDSPRASALTPIARTTSRSAPLTVGWTSASSPDDGDGVEVLIASDTGAVSTARPMVACAFPATALSGTVPAAALSRLSTGEHTVAIRTWRSDDRVGSGTVIRVYQRLLSTGIYLTNIP